VPRQPQNREGNVHSYEKKDSRHRAKQRLAQKLRNSIFVGETVDATLGLYEELGSENDGRGNHRMVRAPAETEYEERDPCSRGRTARANRVRGGERGIRSRGTRESLKILGERKI